MIRRPLIMVVDDEPELVEMLKLRLQTQGEYDVETAFDGVEALEKLQTIEPDLIVLDIMMPKMNGIEFYNKVLGKEGIPKYPILVLTARADLAELFKEMFVSGFITKPFDDVHFMDEINAVISRKFPEQFQFPARFFPFKEGQAPKVAIIEDDYKKFTAISSTFIGAGYTVYAERSGMAAIERIILEPPDIILVDLGLADLRGDLVLRKFRQMPKLVNVIKIVYAETEGTVNAEIADRICDVAGIKTIIQYDDPEQLLRDVENQLEENINKEYPKTD